MNELLWDLLWVSLSFAVLEGMAVAAIAYRAGRKRERAMAIQAQQGMWVEMQTQSKVITHLERQLTACRKQLQERVN